MTPGFIANLEDSTDTFGPLEKVFVHEWSKLRYGVFEEFGYPGDEQYPLFYYERSYTDDGIVNDLKPNFCTDYPLEGTRRYVIFFKFSFHTNMFLLAEKIIDGAEKLKELLFPEEE